MELVNLEVLLGSFRLFLPRSKADVLYDSGCNEDNRRSYNVAVSVFDDVIGDLDVSSEVRKAGCVGGLNFGIGSKIEIF